MFSASIYLKRYFINILIIIIYILVLRITIINIRRLKELSYTKGSDIWITDAYNTIPKQ